MTSVSNERLVDILRARVGTLYVEVIMRDAAIAELEEQVTALQQQVALRTPEPPSYDAASYVMDQARLHDELVDTGEVPPT
jgi:hypothetical protein